MRVTATRSQSPAGGGFTAPWRAINATGSGEDVAALTLDDSGMICDCNRAGEVLFKYRRSDLVRQHVSMLLPQLADMDLMQNGEVNPRLRFLCHIGRSFQAVAQDGQRFAGELFLNVLNNMSRGHVSLLVRPAQEPAIDGGQRASGE